MNRKSIKLTIDYLVPDDITPEELKYFLTIINEGLRRYNEISALTKCLGINSYEIDGRKVQWPKSS